VDAPALLAWRRAGAICLDLLRVHSALTNLTCGGWELGILFSCERVLADDQLVYSPYTAPIVMLGDNTLDVGA
jgi:hypothetical protein